MPRPLTRQQQLENAAFLRELRRTGNVRLAAREVGVKYGTIQHRRAKHPGFAVRWDAALTFAWARLEAGGLRGPSGSSMITARRGRSDDSPHPKPSLEGGGLKNSRRTAGGEPVIVRRNDGKLQMRRALPGKLTKQCEQAFLAALSATANVRLSAAAAGAAEAAFYRRRRQNPAFAREFLLALQEGYDRLEMALLESADPASFEDDHWRHNEPPAIPPMTANQALQLMYLHQKEARLWTTPFPERLRPGETRVARSEMLQMIHEAKLARDRERFRIAEAARLARGDETHAEWGPGELPDLSQVTGWSKASGKAGADESRALFGGWRIGDIGVDQKPKRSKR
ncbi:MAG: hypothetical protein V4659_11375 [Pseudomonadota bacterium]